MLSFYKNDRISLNNGPIFKIQNLAYSAEQARSVQFDNDGARDVAREMKSRARGLQNQNGHEWHPEWRHV